MAVCPRKKSFRQRTTQSASSFYRSTSQGGFTKLLFLDIESSPAQAFVWGLFDQTIPLNHIIDTSSVLCYSARWRGSKEMLFDSVNKSSKKQMLKGVHRLLEEADVVASYNGERYDLPVLNREFILAGMTPPAPYKSVDLLRVAKRKFRFTSNKMDHVSEVLGIGNKHKHPGFKLWVDCMAGDKKAWDTMRRYNSRDVVMLEQIYEKMLPWIPNHPHVGAFDDKPDACPHCGESSTLQRRGYAVTRDVKYPRMQCTGCGAWSRGKSSDLKTRTTLQGIS